MHSLARLAQSPPWSRCFKKHWRQLKLRYRTMQEPEAREAPELEAPLHMPLASSTSWPTVVLRTRQRRHTTECRWITTRRRPASTSCTPSKALTMDISKAFRATLPALRDDQVEHLRRWSVNNCAHALLFRESSAWRCAIVHAQPRPMRARCVRLCGEGASMTFASGASGCT